MPMAALVALFLGVTPVALQHFASKAEIVLPGDFGQAWRTVAIDSARTIYVQTSESPRVIVSAVLSPGTNKLGDVVLTQVDSERFPGITSIAMLKSGCLIATLRSGDVVTGPAGGTMSVRRDLGRIVNGGLYKIADDMWWLVEGKNLSLLTQGRQYSYAHEGATFGGNIIGAAVNVNGCLALRDYGLRLYTLRVNADRMSVFDVPEAFQYTQGIAWISESPLLFKQDEVLVFGCGAYGLGPAVAATDRPIWRAFTQRRGEILLAELRSGRLFAVVVDESSFAACDVSGAAEHAITIEPVDPPHPIVSISVR